MKTFIEHCKEAEEAIIQTYETGTSLDEAEKLAAKFLHLGMMVSNELAKTDLDARMRKSGVKAIRAAVYTEACSKAEKKPTEGALEHILNLDEVVCGEQTRYDEAEVEKNKLERYYDIFNNAHIYFRGVAKGGAFSG